MKLVRQRLLPQMLGVSPTTLWRLKKAGDFPPGYRIGPGTVAFDQDEINAWLAARREQKAGTTQAEQVQR